MNTLLLRYIDLHSVYRQNGWTDSHLKVNLSRHSVHLYISNSISTSTSFRCYKVGLCVIFRLYRIINLGEDMLSTRKWVQGEAVNYTLDPVRVTCHTLHRWSQWIHTNNMVVLTKLYICLTHFHHWNFVYVGAVVGIDF